MRAAITPCIAKALGGVAGGIAPRVLRLPAARRRDCRQDRADAAGLSARRLFCDDTPPSNRHGSGDRPERLTNFVLFPGKFRFFVLRIEESGRKCRSSKGYSIRET
jgi:hypothetical protein